MKTKREVCNIDGKFFKCFKLTTLYEIIDKKVYKILQMCFPEYGIKPWELSVTPVNYFKNENNIVNALDYIFDENKITFDDLIESKINTDEFFTRTGVISLIMPPLFHGSGELILWYLNKKGMDVTYHDFKHKHNGYWKNIENVKYQFQEYIKGLFKDGLIRDIKKDIPFFLHRQYLEDTGNATLYRSIVDKNMYGSIMNCVMELFPEFNLEMSDFKYYLAYDNKTRCNSLEEKKIFDYIYVDLGIKSIKGIGLRRKSAFYNEQEDERYYPDFRIDGLSNKPIIIEYYGLYKPSCKTEMITSYIEKTGRKNKFYKSNEDIIFVDIYPDDLRNDFAEVKRKITSVLSGEGGEKNSERYCEVCS